MEAHTGETQENSSVVNSVLFLVHLTSGKLGEVIEALVKRANFIASFLD